MKFNDLASMSDEQFIDEFATVLESLDVLVDDPDNATVDLAATDPRLIMTRSEAVIRELLRRRPAKPVEKDA